MAREPDRDDRGRRDLRIEGSQLEHRALQMSAVVEIGTQDDLCVHPDPGFREPLEPRQDLGRVPGPAKQGMPELRVGGVDRDVERREALLDDPLERDLIEVAERDVVAVQERQPEVVVLHVEALAHALGKLVDEAEDALVRARRDVARARRGQLEPKIGAATVQPP
jgi:hypothetical protein